MFMPELISFYTCLYFSEIYHLFLPSPVLKEGDTRLADKDKATLKPKVISGADVGA